MFSSVRSSLAVIASAALFSGLLPSLKAQTAPQLLPYTAKLIAGGGTAAIGAGATCPTSGNKSTDTYGDGCLATEIQLSGPRYAAADKNSNIFFSDYTNGLVRRIDASTGVVTTVAGGAASSPTTGTTCGTGVSLDADGDGCLSTLVKLNHPVGLAFAANGDLYFADNGYDNVRRIASTNGVVTTGGTISLIAGNTSTFGYAVNNTAPGGVIVANTQGYLNFPYGITFDAAGNLFIADEGNNAVEVVNLTASTETIQGLTVPPGTIAKIVGYGSLGAKTTNTDCPNYTTSPALARGGCYFGLFTEGAQGVSSLIHFPYGVAVDPSGNVFFSNEFYDDIGRLSPTNVLNNYAGTLNTVAKPPAKSRGTAGSFAVGSPFDIAADKLGNIYFTDASNGLVWRVDGTSKASYVVAGGATTGTICSAHTDTLGDGCPATLAMFGSSGTSFASGSSPGIFGVSVDQYANLYVGDSITNVVRQISSGTQFGNVGLFQSVTNTLDVHFVANDGPLSSGGFVVTSGSGIFTVGTPVCTTNSPDGTTDCLVPVTATPGATGPATGTLTVTSNSASGGTATFPLSVNGVSSPVTRLALTYSVSGTNCAGAQTFATGTTFTFTAAITSTGQPTGTVTFFANGNQIGTPVTVANSQAQITTTFGNPGNYNITAKYSGDTNFQSSSSTSSVPVTTAAPSFSFSKDTSLSQFSSTVQQGGTAVYGLTLNQTVYAGTISFSCSNLPAKATCNFSPQVVTTTVCAASSSVTFSIQTTQGTPAGAGFLPLGNGRWNIALIAGFLLAMAGFGIRRRGSAARLGRLMLVLGLLLASSGLMACGNGTKTITGTPVGTYNNVVVTATGSTGGVVATFPITLTVK